MVDSAGDILGSRRRAKLTSNSLGRAHALKLLSGLVTSFLLVTPACGGDDDDGAGGTSGGKNSGGASTSGGKSPTSGGTAPSSGGTAPKGGAAGSSNKGGEPNTGGTAESGAGGVSGEAGAGAGGGGVGGEGGGSGGGVTVGGGGAGGEGGNGGEAGQPVVNLDPVGLRPVGATLTTYISRNQPPGGSVYYDICPDDQVLIGFKYRNYSDFINGLTGVCGKIVLYPEQGNLLQVMPGSTFYVRGGYASVDGGDAMCPPNTVVVGFEGYANDWVRKITVSCATVDVVNDSSGVNVVVGTPTPIAEFGKPSDPPPDHFPYTGCAAGQLARGSKMNTGNWFEALGLECATPKLTYDRGAPCTTATDCAEPSTCDGTCKPITCTAAAGCSCRYFDGKEYVLCPAAADSTYANAGSYCADQDRRLAWAKSGEVNGWLRATARIMNITGPVWLGADDLTSAGTFTWANSGGPLSGGFTDWNEFEPTAGKHCMTIGEDGSWFAQTCTTAFAFACE